MPVQYFRSAECPPHLMSPMELLEATKRDSIWRHLTLRRRLAQWWVAVKLRAAAKRTVDIVGAGVGVIVLSPLLIATAIAIKLESPGPVFFTQERVGKRGKPFNMIKFRSMRTTAEADKAALQTQNESEDGVLFKMKADPRVTRIGRIIRRFSIDELPQLFNILRGDMAIVGPRPAIHSEVAQYDHEARKRLQTKPGLTCIWQVSGRSDLSFGQQVDLDIQYLRQQSILTDVKLIARTIPAVVTGRGAY